MNGPRSTHMPGTADVRSLVADLDSRISGLAAAVGEADPGRAIDDPAEDPATLVDQARKDWDLLSRRAEDALRSADIAARQRMASERAAIEVERMGRQLDVELDTVEAELVARRSSDGSAADAWRAVGESWRARADELRVQANLARREVQDQAHSNVDRVEQAVGRLRSGIEEARHRAADTSRDLGRPFGPLLDTARETARDAGRWLIEHSGAEDEAAAP